MAISKVELGTVGSVAHGKLGVGAELGWPESRSRLTAAARRKSSPTVDIHSTGACRVEVAAKLLEKFLEQLIGKV